MKHTKRALSLLPLLLLLLLVTTAFAFAEGKADTEAPSRFYQTFWSLVPAIIAIGLALITKEVYTSLFVGIVVGGLLYADFSLEGTLTHIFNDGVAASLSDSYNVGILVFLVILGILVVLMNKAGGSAVALILIVIYYLIRRVIPFTEIASSIPEGFKSMVPAILILTFAWSLKAMTDSLGAKQFVDLFFEKKR